MDGIACAILTELRVDGEAAGQAGWVAKASLM